MKKIILEKKNKNCSTIKVIFDDNVITFNRVIIKKIPLNSNNKEESLKGELRRLIMFNGYEIVDKNKLEFFKWIS